MFCAWQIESGCLRVQRLKSPNTDHDGPTSPSFADDVYSTGDKSSRHHQRTNRPRSKYRSGQHDQKYRGSSSTKSKMSTSLPVVQRSSNRWCRTPAGLFHFHSPEAATNSTTSLPADAAVLSRCLSPEDSGLVRGKSDLGPIAEFVKVSSRDKVTRSLRLCGKSVSRPVF